MHTIDTSSVSTLVAGAKNTARNSDLERGTTNTNCKHFELVFWTDICSTAITHMPMVNCRQLSLLAHALALVSDQVPSLKVAGGKEDRKAAQHRFTKDIADFFSQVATVEVPKRIEHLADIDCSMLLNAFSKSRYKGDKSSLQHLLRPARSPQCLVNMCHGAIRLNLEAKAVLEVFRAVAILSI